VTVIQFKGRASYGRRVLEWPLDRALRSPTLPYVGCLGSLARKRALEFNLGTLTGESAPIRSETKVGAALDLVVSKGIDTIPVPKVTGRSVNTAKKELTKAGFTVGKVRYRMNENQDEGIVLEQTPAADQQAAKDSAVELVVNTFQ
jgi:hypothetical protein